MDINDIKQIKVIENTVYNLNETRNDVIRVGREYINDLDTNNFQNVFNEKKYETQCPLAIFKVLIEEVGMNPEEIIVTGDRKTVEHLNQQTERLEKLINDFNIAPSDCQVDAISNGIETSFHLGDWTAGIYTANDFWSEYDYQFKALRYFPNFNESHFEQCKEVLSPDEYELFSDQFAYDEDKMFIHVRLHSDDVNEIKKLMKAVEITGNMKFQ